MPIKSFGHEYARLAAISGLCAACLAVAGYFPTRAMAGDHSLVGMAVGIGVSLFAALIGAIPICMAASQSPTQGPTAVLAGTAVRFILVLEAPNPKTGLRCSNGCTPAGLNAKGTTIRFLTFSRVRKPA